MIDSRASLARMKGAREGEKVGEWASGKAGSGLKRAKDERSESIEEGERPKKLENRG